MRKLFTLCLLVFSLSASAQWQQTGSKVRYVNGLGIPTRDTAAGVLADSSQILIRPADSALYVKYKRTWLRVGGGGGSIAGSGTTNYIPKFTSSTAIGNSSIFDNGNVGIGTTSPGYKLDVNGAILSTTSLYKNSAGTNVLNVAADDQQYGGSSSDGGIFVYGPNKLFLSTNSARQVTITGGGNVGIGTTSPSAKLQVVGAGLFGGNGAGSYGLAISNNDQSNVRLVIENTGSGGQAFSIIGGIASASNAGLSIYDNTNAATRLYISNTGNVGIGTTSPATDLHISRAGSSTFRLSNISNSTNVELGISTALGFVGTQSNNSFGLFTNNTERMRITSGGNALIGTTTDNGTDRLQVSGSASVTSLFGVGTSPSAGTVHIKTTSPSIAIDDNDNAGTAAIRFRPQSASFATRGSIELISTGSAAPTRFVIASTDTMTFRTNNVERMRITSAGGNVLISKTTDNGIDKLQVNGSIDAKGFAQAYTPRSSTYTATTSDYLIDCTTGTFTVNLPDALLNVGRILIIKNSGTGTITVDGSGTQTIDGAATYSLSAQWATVQIMCDGNNWKILAKF